MAALFSTSCFRSVATVSTVLPALTLAWMSVALKKHYMNSTQLYDENLLVQDSYSPSFNNTPGFITHFGSTVFLAADKMSPKMGVCCCV